MFRMHQPRNLLEFSSQTEVRFLLLVRDTGYTVASRVVLHRGSGTVLLPRDQAAMLNMLQLTRAANYGQFTICDSQPLTRDQAAMLEMLQPTRVRLQQ
jgi:hypothetical protein